MNAPRVSICLSKASFPQNRHSNVLLTGAVGVSPGFPLKACGNDGIRIHRYAATCEALIYGKTRRLRVASTLR